MGRQFVTDLLVVAWIGFWVWAALKLYDLVEKLAVPGEKLARAGDGMAGGLSDAGSKVDNVPGVGNDLAGPFNSAADSAKAIADAGREQQQVVHDLALALSILMVVLPLSLVLFVWLPLRLRWIRRASLAVKLRNRRAGQDLLALRALANQPIRRLIAISPDPSAGWRQGDPAMVGELAALELRSLGLR